LFLYDLKMMDAAKHLKYTGVDNALILHNLKALAESGAVIVIRMPLIGGVNDDENDIAQAATFINALAGDKPRVELLPYHNIADHKYNKLGKTYAFSDLTAPDEQRQGQIVALFESHGVQASIK